MSNPKASECKGCTHWKPLYSSTGKGEYRACNYFFDTGATRLSMGAWGKCTVREEKNEKPL